MHAIDPDNEVHTATINPSSIFQFEPRNIRKLTMTTKTQCNLGKSAPKHYDGNYLGYYEDKINISMSCVETHGAQLSFLGPIVERTKKKKTVISNSSTHTKYDAKENIAKVMYNFNLMFLQLIFNSRVKELEIGPSQQRDFNSYANSFEVYNEQVDEFPIHRKGIT